MYISPANIAQTQTVAMAIPAFAPVERPVFEVKGREIGVGEDVEVDVDEDVEVDVDEDVESGSEREGTELGLGERLVLEAEVLLLDGTLVLAVEVPGDSLDVDVTVKFISKLLHERNTHAPDAETVTPIAQ